MGAASTPEHAQYGLIFSHFRALMKCKHKEVSLAKKKKKGGKRKKGAGFILIWPTFLFPSSCQGGEALAAGITGILRQQASRFRTKARKILSQASLVQKEHFPVTFKPANLSLWAFHKLQYFHEMPLILFFPSTGFKQGF